MSEYAAPPDRGSGVVAPQVTARPVAFEAPWTWLARGWSDLWAHPGISLTYGALFSLGAALILVGLAALQMQALILVLAGGFLLVGPFMAVGLYEVSRRSEAGVRATLGDALLAGLRAEGQLSFMGAILLFIYFAWVRIAMLLLVLFLGEASVPPASEFLHTLLFTPHGLGLLVVGTLVGGGLAALVYAISAISVPMLLEHRIDAFTAIGYSVSAVAANPRPMALWAALIAGFIALGLLTLGVGLIVAFPLIGHATWHAYRDLTTTKHSSAANDP